MRVVHLIPAVGYERHSESTGCKCGVSVMTTDARGNVRAVKWVVGEILLVVHRPWAARRNEGNG